MKPALIAPCGMNCAICLGYLRDKNKCPGCRVRWDDKFVSRVKCIIKNCEMIKKNKWKYCSVKCDKFPCTRLKNLDKRYRTKYCMSMIDNLKNIDEKGIRKFVKQEEKRWIKSGKVFCVHNKKLYSI
ncbi:MAG: DUF3795 domain-containing protein [Nanobdellota archaeon]